MRVHLTILLLATLALFGCSDGGSDSPAPNAAHPDGWIALHGTEALKSPNYADCALCHGTDLRGQGDVPSCYSTSYNGQACHAEGPAPHKLDGSYRTGKAHGRDAKTDLTVCQRCHGQSGGPGSNPRFNRGIDAAGGQGCEGCHGVNLAHPVDWAGPNSTFHYSAANIQQSCTLCHGTGLDGAGGVGPGCVGCHDSVTTFTLDCSFCHGYPPSSIAKHVGAAGRSAHNVCVVCHGAKENATGGYFAANPAYALFDKSTDTPGDHWNGRINMNSGTAYSETTFGCDTALCHGNVAAYQLSDSGLPVAYGNYGSGSATLPHPIPFLSPALHGPAAKGLTASFPNGLRDCQPCHASATTPPRFNVGITITGGVGCEGCHNDFTAHPSSGGRGRVSWYDGIYTHSNVNGFSTMCTLCHGANLQGDIGPACTSCHQVNPVTYPDGCVSCHSEPPNGGTLDEDRPNRSGEHGERHSEFTCSNCHFGATSGTPTHFDFTKPATIQFDLVAPDTMTAISTEANTTCTGTCHGENHNSESWY